MGALCRTMCWIITRLFTQVHNLQVDVFVFSNKVNRSASTQYAYQQSRNVISKRKLLLRKEPKREHVMKFAKIMLIWVVPAFRVFQSPTYDAWHAKLKLQNDRKLLALVYYHHHIMVRQIIAKLVAFSAVLAWKMPTAKLRLNDCTSKDMSKQHCKLIATVTYRMQFCIVNLTM